MPDSLFKHYRHINSPDRFFSHYWSVCGSLNRKHDLEQLIAWATQKRLARPLAHYQKLLIDEEQRLWRYQQRHSFTFAIAELAVVLSDVLNPKPKHTYFKGYAAKYRYTLLRQGENQLTDVDLTL
jgi:hypothetical protein